MDTVGERIKKRRLELNLSQDELAGVLGFRSRTSIYKIESGGQDLRLKHIKQMARALKTTPEYLLGNDERKETAMVADEFCQSLINTSKETLEGIEKQFGGLLDVICTQETNPAKIARLALLAGIMLGARAEQQAVRQAKA
ncbi:MAG: hypothetical protein DBY32_04615 [Phascolarctobacterium sp.]|nr:MAG: hypothetical protein DBY32_04615 [Phascolarctobacterium sp.]